MTNLYSVLEHSPTAVFPRLIRLPDPFVHHCPSDHGTTLVYHTVQVYRLVEYSDRAQSRKGIPHLRLPLLLQQTQVQQFREAPVATVKQRQGNFFQ